MPGLPKVSSRRAPAETNNTQDKVHVISHHFFPSLLHQTKPNWCNLTWTSCTDWMIHFKSRKTKQERKKSALRKENVTKTSCAFSFVTKCISPALIFFWRNPLFSEHWVCRSLLSTGLVSQPGLGILERTFLQQRQWYSLINFPYLGMCHLVPFLGQRHLSSPL